MKCPQCHARNSPAALACHNCHAELSREELASPAALRPASTWRARARSAAAPAAACLLLLGALRGGQWAGDWLALHPPAPTARDAVGDRAALEARYEAWKQAHALPVEDLMALYSPDARIVLAEGQPGTLSLLLLLAQQVRRDGRFDQVSDVGPVDISIDGALATIKTRHRYGHSSDPQHPHFGSRTLIWEMRSGAWLVVEDRFPNSFSTQP